MNHKGKIGQGPITAADLMLMRMEFKAMKERHCQDIDAMVARIDRMLPPDDDMRYQRQKAFTTEEWEDFLGLRKGNIF